MPRRIKSELKDSGFDHFKDIAVEVEGEATENLDPDISVYRPGRQGIRKVLGDLEAEIMEYIWDNIPVDGPGITVREVYEAFRLNRVIAYTTVMSTMARLGRKHLLTAQKKDVAFLYRPAFSKEEFVNNFVSRILENLLVSFSQTTETHLDRLVKEGNREHIAALRARVENQRNKKKPGV